MINKQTLHPLIHCIKLYAHWTFWIVATILRLWLLVCLGLFLWLEFFYLYGDVTIKNEGFRILFTGRHLHACPLISEDPAACNICCDTEHPFLIVCIVISEDMSRSQLLPSISSVAVTTFLKSYPITAGIRAADLPYAGWTLQATAPSLQLFCVCKNLFNIVWLHEYRMYHFFWDKIKFWLFWASLKWHLGIFNLKCLSILFSWSPSNFNGLYLKVNSSKFFHNHVSVCQ